MTRKLLLLLVAGLCASAFTLANAAPAGMAKGQRASGGHWLVGGTANPMPVSVSTPGPALDTAGIPMVLPTAGQAKNQRHGLRKQPAPLPFIPPGKTPAIASKKPGTDNNGGPDGDGYRWIDSDDGGSGHPTYQWATIDNVQGSFSGDDNGYSASMPFTFTYRGTGYSTLYWTTNGAGGFTNAYWAYYYEEPFPSTDLVPACYGVMYRDLQTNSGRYGWSGTTPNRTFIISWDAATNYGGSGNYAMQLILQENGEALYEYQTFDRAGSNGSVGYQNVAGTVGENIGPSLPHASYAVRVYVNTLDHDVGCTGIPSPSGDTGTYVPTATIRNFGANNEGSFGAHYYATGPGATYDQTLTGLHLQAGHDTVVSFPSWHITARGMWAMKCSTRLDGDGDNTNDKFATNRYIGPNLTTNVLKQVTGGYMYGPAGYGQYDMGYFFTPQVNGQVSAIGRYRGSYLGDSSVCDLWRVSDAALLAQVTVGDSGWAGVAISPVNVYAGTQYCVSTYGGNNVYYYSMPYVPYVVNNVSIDHGEYYYGGNQLPNNNGGSMCYGAADIWFDVIHHAKDVATTSIPSPAGDTGTYVPSATIHNWGDSTATSFGAHYYATGPGATYDQTITSLHLRSGADTVITFSSWHITARGVWAIQCSTQLTGDEDNTNDKYATQRDIDPHYFTNVLDSVSGLTVYGPANYNGYVGGYYFTPQLNGVISCLGRYRGNVVGDTSSVSLWRVSDQTLLAQVNVGDSGWGARPITPVAVTQGTQYCVSTYNGTNWYYGYLPYTPYVQNNISIDAGWYAYGAGNVMPAMYNGGTFIMGCPDIFFSLITMPYDLGCTAIPSPQGDTGTYTPSTIVHNFGTSDASSFAVRYLATGPGATYDHTVTGLHLVSHTDTTVLFPSWHITVQGAWALSCSTEFASDTYNINDKFAVTRYIPLPTTNILSQVTGGSMNGPSGWGAYSMGFYFTPTANGQVLALGRYRGSHTGDNSTVKLWLVSNGSLLASATATDSGWGCTGITPVSLTAGTQYAISTHGGSNVYYYGMPYVPYTVNGIRIDYGSYYYGDSMPNNNCGGTVYGAPDLYYLPMPIVNVTSPNGGESWTVGSSHNVIWNSAFSTKDSVVLMDATDTTIAYIIGVNTPPHDTIAWTIPNHRSTNWKVKVYGFGPNGNGSDMSNAVFSIIDLPYAFDLLRPTNHATEVPQADTLIWAAADGATNYDIYLDTVPTPALWHANVGNVTRYAYSGFPKGRHYYWAVVAKNTAGNRRCNTDFDFTTVRGHDVGTVSLTVPAQVDSGATVNPTAVVHNYGTQAENFDVALTFAGLSGYTPVVTVTGLSVGVDTTINFPTTPPLTDRAGYAVKCTTELTGDQNTSNDAATANVAVVVRNVGVVTFGVPAAVDSGTTVTPTVTVRNYGTQVASFNVNVVIGGAFYNRTQSISGLSMNKDTVINFPATGVMRLRAGYAAKCTTQLTNDMIPANDRVAQTIAVNVHDLAAVGVVAPSGQIPPGPITPMATFRNRGTLREPTVVYFMINSTPAYFDSVTFSATDVVGLPLGVDTTISFPSWTAIPGTYVPRCSVYAPDQIRANDAVSGQAFQCGHVDVAVLSITAPAAGSSIDSSEAITPSVMARNNGELTANIDAWFFIDSVGGSVYNQHVVVTGVAPGASAPISFPEWAKPHSVHNSYMMRCSVYVAFDGDPSNNVATGTFSITARPLIPPGWNPLTNVPAGPKAKNVKDGAALAYGQEATDIDTGYIYAFKGNNRYEFYRYNIDSKEWISRDSIPAIGRLGKKKAVKKGSALIVGTDGKVYGAKGNNTLEFWCYDPSKPAGQHWGQLADVPPGAKNLKEGAGMVAVDNHIYLLRGSGTTDFYRYNIDVPGWETMALAPTGNSLKPYKNGSSIAYDGGDTIWCLKGSYNEFAAYSVSGNIWVTKDTLPRKSPPSTKKTKVKDGSQIASDHNGLVYALKGGNTNEFWTYKCSDHAWYTAAPMPTLSKKVKGGGGLTYSAKTHMLYAFRGNNTLEFWVFNPFSALMAPEHKNDGAMSAGLQNIGDFKLSISPNPFTSLTHVSYTLPKSGSVALRLYDVAGQLVTTLAQGYTLAGNHSALLNADKLAHGIYLLKFESEGYSTTSKLIIE